MRIVSLLPSATEIVYALGLGDSLTGVSHECDFPTDVASKPRMIEPVINMKDMPSERIDELVRTFSRRGGRLYRVDAEALRRADPDVVITQELCDVCAVGVDDVLPAIGTLKKPVRILSLNPHTLADVKQDVRRVGEALGSSERAAELVRELEAKAKAIGDLTSGSSRCRVLCLEWISPLMNAGHWVPEMVDHAGGIDGLANQGAPSTYIHPRSIAEYDPAAIILMPCGFTTDRAVSEAKRFFEIPDIGRVKAVREGRVYATDGHNYFSRPGPRLFDGIRILAHMIHPELFDEPLGPSLGRPLLLEEHEA